MLPFHNTINFFKLVDENCDIKVAYALGTKNVILSQEL
ncbi:MAG: hypothetical protein KR126chlam2_00478 [Chlamydiae bacterium]|nr:hypothetical protein [Chlamydiota bacterium]